MEEEVTTEAVPLSTILLQLQPLICDLLTSNECHTENTVSKAIKVFVFFLCQGAKWQKRWNMCSKAKKLFPFRFFFTANLKVPCYLDKINRIFQAVDTPGGTISLLTWKLPQPGIKRKRKSVLLFFHQGLRVLVEQREMNLLKDMCIHVSIVWKSRRGPNLNPRGTLTNNWDLCSSIQDC